MLAGALLVVYSAFVIANGTLAAVSRSEAKPSGAAADTRNERNSRALFLAGRNIFRHDTFGDQAFWGEALQLHRVIAGAKNGGVGPWPQPEVGPCPRAQSRCRGDPEEDGGRDQGRPSRPRTTRR